MENPIPIIEGIEKETDFKFSKICKIIMIICAGIAVILLSILGAVALAEESSEIKVKLLILIVFVWVVFIIACLFDVTKYLKRKYYDNILIVADKPHEGRKIMPRWLAKEYEWKIIKPKPEEMEKIKNIKKKQSDEEWFKERQRENQIEKDRKFNSRNNRGVRF